MRKPLVIHPLLFAAFPIIFLFSYNIQQVSFSEVVSPLAFVLGFTLLAVVCLGLILKDGKKAGLMVSICLVLFFSYGHVYDIIEGWQVGGHTVGRHRYLLVTWVELLFFALYWRPRTGSAMHAVTKVLNAIALCLVMFSLLNIGLYAARTRSPSQGRVSDPTDSVNPGDPTNGDELPDIYYIILDGYANSGTLEEIYGYDNGRFLDNLTERGFYVAGESRSNYPHTFLSLASSLNMEYINYLTDRVGEDSRDQAIPHQMIKDSAVVRFLRSRGYQFIHFSSGWGPTYRNQYADLSVQCGATNEFAIVLLRTTVLRSLEEYLAWGLRTRVLCTFSKLAEVHNIEGPKFVFAHVIPPHPPYLFGRDGESVSTSELVMNVLGHWDEEKYLNQLIFVTKRVEILLDEILSSSRVPPIIILQSDHGPASLSNSAGQDGSSQPTDAMVIERTGILNAYYLPEGCIDFCYDSITPVNTFRLIFNCYFETSYPMLEDEVYFCTYQKPYEFVDITDIVSGD